MRNRWFLLALLLGLGVGLGVVLNGTAGADEDSDRIGRLVKHLGSSKFTVRDRAKRELEVIGMPALDALRKAARSTDLETSRRAGELVKRMEEKIALENLLAPKKVRLKLKDTPVTEAVDQLARQSGYTIQIQGDRAALASRKITLDTGETTFWQAFDQLCQKAGLVENSNPHNPYLGRPVPIQPLPPGRLPPVQIQPAPAPVPLPALPPGALKRLPPVRLPPVQVQPLPAPGPMILPVFPPAGVQPAPAIRILPAPAPAPQLLPALPPAGAKPQQGALQFRVETQAQVVQAVAPAQVQVAPPPKVAAPVQVKIQVQVGQVQIAPAPANPPVLVQPGGIARPYPIQPYPQGQFNLSAGKPQEVPTAYSGAVRIRALPSHSPVPGMPTPARKAGETILTLEVSAEPRLQNFQLLGNVQIEKAVDDKGQTLSVPMGSADPFAAPEIELGGLRGRAIYRYNPYMTQARFAYVRLKLGEKSAKTLKQLSGHISAQMLAAPQALITVEDVLKAAGKKFKGVGGNGAIEMLSTEKQADGSYKVQFRMEQPTNWIQAPFQGPIAPGLGGQAGGVVQIGNGRRVVRSYVNTQGLPALVDAKGRALQLTQVPTRMYRGGFGVMTMEVTMVFRAHDGQGAPAQLVLHGQRNISVQVPFTLRDVPLP